MLDQDALVTWLNDRADEAVQRTSARGTIIYAIYTGLRDRIIRGDFDAREDTK